MNATADLLPPDALPGSWLALFDGARLATKLGEAAILATVDEQGWPHLSYLSVGELLADGRERLLFAVWPTSRTAANLLRSGAAALQAALDGAVWEARLAVRRLDGGDALPGLAVFEARVGGVRRHAAPYAEVEGLVRFRLGDEPGTLARWRRQARALEALARTR